MRSKIKLVSIAASTALIGSALWAAPVAEGGRKFSISR